MSEQPPISNPSGNPVTEPIPKPLHWVKENSLPLLGILFVAIVLCLIVHYSTIKIDWSNTHEATGSIVDIFQVLALLAGGWWAYFKFIKGRTFKESLTPAVAGRFVSLDGVIHLIASIQIKNVGSSKVDFDREASALILYEYTPSAADEIHRVADKRLTSFAVFNEKDRYIEPNELIQVQRFISIPGPLKLAYRLEMKSFLSTVTSGRQLVLSTDHL